VIWFWQFLLILYALGYVVCVTLMLVEAWPTRHEPFGFRPETLSPLVLVLLVLVLAIMWPFMLLTMAAGR
jgi:uncharacterized membrane protein YdjX (TVP38/TMEM64 family)